MGILNPGKMMLAALTACTCLVWMHFRRMNCGQDIAKDTARELLSNRVNSPDQVFSSLWVQIDGLQYHAQIAARHPPMSKPPLVLIHGLGVSGSYFLPFAKKLVPEFDVYIPDLPGHGKSGNPARPMDIKALAKALEAWMAKAGIERAILIGQSMGCQVVSELAFRCPDKVDRIVMIGLTPDPHARSVAAHLVRLLRAAMHERLSIAWPVAKDYLRMNWRIFPELMFMLEDPIQKKLERLCVPSMVVRGQHDAIFPQYWFEEAITLSRAQESAVITGGAHAVQYSMPENLLAAVRNFISSQGSDDDRRHVSVEE